MTPAATDAKALLMQQFQQVLADRKRQAYRVVTKEEEAQKRSDRELLNQAATYTPDRIVRGLADLQLDFDTTVTTLGDRLENEADTLNQLRQAIQIERQNCQQLQQVCIVAEALDLLRREHQEKQRQLQDAIADRQEALDKEMAQTRKTWDKEQQDFETQVAEAQQRLQKQRQQAEADERYELELQSKIDADEYARIAREQELQLTQDNREKEKDWTQREAFLSDRQKELEANRKKVATFEEELKKAFNKAKEDAIREVNRDATTRANLLEKAWEGTQQGYEVKIASLQAAIAQQDEQIADLSTQLQTALQQARELSVQAFSKASQA